MTRIDKLRQLNKETAQSAKDTLKDIKAMSKECDRVANVARDVNIIVTDLDRQFKKATGLRKSDIKFLFFATGLQALRQYVMGTVTSRQSDKLSAEPAHKAQDRLFSNFDGEPSETGGLFYAPTSQIIGTYGVPYDVVSGSKEFNLGGDGLGLSGHTHRARTAGHDPFLGWVFGTANILTNTLTPYTLLSSFHVQNGRVISPCLTPEVFMHVKTRWDNDKPAFAAALIKQALHFSSDMYSKNGLPLPLISKTISPEFAQTLATFGSDLGTGINPGKVPSVLRADFGNVLKVAASAMWAVIINSLIGMIHGLYYDESVDSSLKLYSVRTRKILSYSNLIATASNIIATSVMAIVGAKTGNAKMVQKAADYFDLGGLIVTIYRIITDYNYIKQIKQEFLEQEFYKIVMGEQ